MTSSKRHTPIDWIGMALAIAIGSAGGHAVSAQQRQMPPAWPYAQTQLPPGEIPPQAAAPKTPPVTNPDARET